MGWEDEVLDGVARTASKTRRSGPASDWTGYLLRLHPDLLAALNEIAQNRGVSVQTYLRRLIAMSIAKEKGQRLLKWLALVPPASPYGTDQTASFRARPPERGQGMHGMCTHPGCDQVHT
jgi:hypothetical protein